MYNGGGYGDDKTVMSVATSPRKKVKEGEQISECHPEDQVAGTRRFTLVNNNGAYYGGRIKDKVVILRIVISLLNRSLKIQTRPQCALSVLALV